MLVVGVLAAHLVGGWGLLQLDAVQQAVRDVAPVLMVNMITPQEPPRPAAVPPPPPRPEPRRAAQAPIPAIAAAPSLTPAPAEFLAPPPVPAPPPAGVAPAPPTPPLPAPAAALKQVPPSAVRYLKMPALNFPRLAKRAGESGTVVLRITVDESGRLKQASVHRSSGFERIDQAALQDIRSARFAAQMEDGRAVEWQTLAPLAYEL